MGGCSPRHGFPTAGLPVEIVFFATVVWLTALLDAGNGERNRVRFSAR
jgi:hypothetical protein